MRHIGIDISKDTFMVAFPEGKGFRTQSYRNTAAGIRSFIKELKPGEDQCVMEATGNYSMMLLYLLKKNGIDASLLNPRQSKYFAKTLMSIVKTDKVDACLLAEYGIRMKPPVFTLPDDAIILLKQKRTVLRQFRQQLTALRNVQHSLDVLPVKDKSSIHALRQAIKQLSKHIEELEKDIIDTSDDKFKTQMKRLQTIKGIGATLAASLIIATSGFSCFDNAKQVSRYLGLCPTYQQSGTSIHIKGHISRTGDSHIRGQLYLAAMSAIRCNTACKELYTRLRTNGKSGRLALVAVGNKLVRQAFAVVKNDKDYQDGFVSEPPKKI